MAFRVRPAFRALLVQLVEPREKPVPRARPARLDLLALRDLKVSQDRLAELPVSLEPRALRVLRELLAMVSRVLRDLRVPREFRA